LLLEPMSGLALTPKTLVGHIGTSEDVGFQGARPMPGLLHDGRRILISSRRSLWRSRLREAFVERGMEQAETVRIGA
jgi:hypothetical protein